MARVTAVSRTGRACGGGFTPTSPESRLSARVCAFPPQAIQAQAAAVIGGVCARQARECAKKIPAHLARVKAVLAIKYSGVENRPNP